MDSSPVLPSSNESDSWRELQQPSSSWSAQQQQQQPMHTDEQAGTDVGTGDNDLWPSWSSVAGSPIAEGANSSAQVLESSSAVALPNNPALVDLHSLLLQPERSLSNLETPCTPLLQVHQRAPRRACAACRKQKAACDQNEQRPCTRCKRLGRPCVDAAATPMEDTTLNHKSIRSKKRKHVEEDQSQSEIQLPDPLVQVSTRARIETDSEIFSHHLLSTLDLLQVWETVWRVHCSIIELPAPIVRALGWHRQVSHLFLLLSDMLIQSDFDAWLGRHTAILRATRLWKSSPMAPWADRSTRPMHLAWGLEDTADTALDAPGRVRDSSDDSILSPALRCSACGSGVESAQMRLEFCTSGEAVFDAQESAWIAQLEQLQKLSAEKEKAIPIEGTSQDSKLFLMDPLLQQAMNQNVLLRMEDIQSAARDALGQVARSFCQTCAQGSRGASSIDLLSSKSGRSTAATEFSSPLSAVSLGLTPSDSRSSFSSKEAESGFPTPIMQLPQHLQSSIPLPPDYPPLLIALDCVTHLCPSPSFRSRNNALSSSHTQFKRELISPAHASWCPMSSSELVWRGLATAEEIAQAGNQTGSQPILQGCLCESSSPVLARLCQNSSMSIATGHSTSSVIRIMLASGAQGCRRFVVREQWGDILLREVQQWKACINVIAGIAQQLRSTYASFSQLQTINTSSERSAPMCSAWSHLSPTTISSTRESASSSASSAYPRCHCPGCAECSALITTFARTQLISSREYEEGVMSSKVTDGDTTSTPTTTTAAEQYRGHSSAAGTPKCHLVRIHTQAGLELVSIER